MINNKYVYFAVCNTTGKILNGWELISDIESLKYYAHIDMADMDYKKSQYKLLSWKTLNSKGVNPYMSENWHK